jgi:hypothetical protein
MYLPDGDGGAAAAARRDDVTAAWAAAPRHAPRPRLGGRPPARAPSRVTRGWRGSLGKPVTGRDLPAARPRSFRRYASLVEDRLMPKYGAAWHWAKIDPPRGDAARLARARAALAARFPLGDLAAARAELDPRGVLGNELFDSLLSPPGDDVPPSSG